MHPSSIRSTRLPPAYPHCPENARAFQAASDYGLARGLHHSSADKEPSAAELRVTHPFRIAFEVVGLRLNVVPQFGLLGTYRPQRSDQVFDLSLIEPVLMGLDPSHFGRRVGGIQFGSQFPHMFASVVQIDNLNRSREMFLRDAPVVMLAVGQDHAVVRPAPASPIGFRVEGAAKLTGCLDAAQVSGVGFVTFRVAFRIDGGLRKDTTHFGFSALW